MKLLYFAKAWMDLEKIILNELSQSVKENATWSHLYVESNEHNKLTNGVVKET